MGKWRRKGLIALAVATLAALLQTVPPPPELWAGHQDSNPGYRWVSAADQVITTDNYWHDNYWICYNPGDGPLELEIGNTDALAIR